jgi:hypothetical protein
MQLLSALYCGSIDLFDEYAKLATSSFCYIFVSTQQLYYCLQRQDRSALYSLA